MQCQWKIYLAVLFLCVWGAVNSLAQGIVCTSTPKYRIHVERGRFDNANRRLTTVVGELVELTVTKVPGKETPVTSVYWNLAQKKNEKYEVLKEALPESHLQLFSSDDSTDNLESKDKFEARRKSYATISGYSSALANKREGKGSPLANTVILKAVKPVTSGEYRVYLFTNEGKADAEDCIDIIVEENHQIRIAPLGEAESKADKFHIEAGTGRDFQVLESAANSGNRLELYDIYVKSSDEGFLKILPLDSENQPTAAESNQVQTKLLGNNGSHNRRFRIIALNGPEPGGVHEANLTVSNHPPGENIIKQDEYVGSKVPIHIHRPRIVIDPKSISLLQNSSGKVTVRLSGGVPGQEYDGKIDWKSDNEEIPAAAADGKSLTFTVRSENVGEAIHTATYKLTNPATGVSEKLLPAVTAAMNVTIRSTAHTAVFEGPSTLLIGKAEKLKVTLYDQANKPLGPDDRDRFFLEPDGEEAKKVVSAHRIGVGSGLWEVTALGPGTARLRVMIDGKPLADYWEMRVTTVSEFKPVRVALNIMDEQTAGDLFGKQTSKEFYAVRVRIFNNLDRDVDGRFLGKSILAYSDSIEASVGLEVRKSLRFENKNERRLYHQAQQVEKKRIEDEIKEHEKALERLALPTGSPGAKENEKNNEEEARQIKEKLRQLKLELQIVDEEEGVWAEFTAKDARLIDEYSLPLANPDNPYPLGMVVSSDKPQAISDAMSPGAPLRVGEAHEVTSYEKGQNISFVLPEGLSILPGVRVHWWSEDLSVVPKPADAAGTANNVPTPIVTFSNSGLGLAQITNQGTALVSVIVGGRRYSRVIVGAAAKGKEKTNSTTPGEAAPAQETTKANQSNAEIYQQIELYPVSQVESGNNLVVKLNAKEEKAKETGALGWNVFPAAENDKIKLIINNNQLYVNGLVNGTATIISNETSKADKANNKRYALVANVVLADPAAQLPPSVYIDADGKPKYFRHMFRYRPYTFDVMINSSSERDRRDGRKRKFNLLNGLFSAASLYALAKPENRTARRLSTIGGILPSVLESYYPEMSGAQRQNYVSQTMKPLEEIPFGSDISRVIFFPKSSFRGMIPGHETRISRIDTSYFNITVAILDKHTATYNAVAGGSRD